MTTATLSTRLPPPTAQPVPARPSGSNGNEAAPTEAWPTPPPVANMKMRLAPDLNIVVLEFHDANGEITRTLPTERELRAYTLGQDPAVPGAPAVDRNA